MPNHMLFKNVSDKDLCGSSVDDDITNKPYCINIYDSLKLGKLTSQLHKSNKYQNLRYDLRSSKKTGYTGTAELQSFKTTA